MTTLHEAAQKALEALEEAITYTSSPSWSPSMTEDCKAAIEALRALAQHGDATLINEGTKLAQQVEQQEPDTRTDDGGCTFPIERRIIQTKITKDISTAQPDDAIIRAWQAGYYHAGYTNDLAYADKMAREYAGAAPAAQPQCETARVLEWMRTPNRKAAQLAFTEGPERQAAYWIEIAQGEQAPQPTCKQDLQVPTVKENLRVATGWVAPKDRYAVPVLFNPYTGEPRDVRDVQSDPQGVLIVPPGKVEILAAKGADK